MPGLTAKQVDVLLTTPVIERLATVREDGAPYIVPVGQHWDGESTYGLSRTSLRHSALKWTLVVGLPDRLSTRTPFRS